MTEIVITVNKTELSGKVVSTTIYHTISYSAEYDALVPAETGEKLLTLIAEKGDGKVLESVKISKPQKAIEVQGEIQKDAPVELKMTLDNLNLSFAELNKVKEADISVMNIMTKETENIKFTRHGDILIASVPTVPAQDEVHFDVILLVALFGITIWLSQKVMMATTSNKNQDATQAAIQKSMGKIMPIMIVLTFVLIPIPAGALLYLVTSNIFQIAQTLIINKQLEIEENNKQKQTNSKENVIDAKVIDAQVVENKDQDKK